jgi:hypothetical protein
VKRTTAAIAVLVAGASLGAATGTALALWSDDVGVRASVGIGYVHYAVGDARDPAAILTDPGTFTDPDGGPGWRLPARVLADLAPGEPQTAVVQIDGYSQGNRGLEYWLDGLAVDGDRGLVDAAQLRIVEVDRPGDCVAGELAGLEARYAGEPRGAHFDDVELVAPRQFHEPDYGSWDEDAVTEYLCVELSLPPDAPGYGNTVTATGTGREGTEPRTVDASDDWSAGLTPSAAQRAATVTLTFPYATYRPGAAGESGSSAVTP